MEACHRWRLRFLAEKPKLVGTMVEPYPTVAEINSLLSQVLIWLESWVLKVMFPGKFDMDATKKNRLSKRYALSILADLGFLF